MSRIYEICLLLVAIYAIFRFREVDRGTCYLCALIWLGALTEITGKISVARYHTNILVYNISSLCEFLIITGYFNQSIKKLKLSRIGPAISVTGLICFVLNTIYLQPINEINSNFLFFECLMVTCLSLYSIYLMLATPDLQLTRKTNFWISATFLFYQCANLFSWGAYNYEMLYSDQSSGCLDICLLLTSIVSYCAYFLILFLYPKMRRANV